MSNNPEVKRVMAFWFNRPPMEWIIAPKGLDEQLVAEFGDLVLKARGNELDKWADDPEGSLALVALLDQFSRNMFRGSSDAWSADAKAFETTTKAIARNFDQKFTVIKASAFYFPLLQQESFISAIAARSLFQALKPRCTDDEEHKWVDMGIDASERHLLQLQLFGRYPTKNALLGRNTTPDEAKFLENYKSSVQASPAAGER